MAFQSLKASVLSFAAVLWIKNVNLKESEREVEDWMMGLAALRDFLILDFDFDFDFDFDCLIFLILLLCETRNYVQWVSLLAEQRARKPCGVYKCTMHFLIRPLCVYTSCSFSLSTTASSLLMSTSPFSTSPACFFGGLMLFHSTVSAPIMEKQDIANATVKVFVIAPL